MFGLENIGKESVEDAHKAIADLLVKISPLLRDVENRFGGILHGLLDRFEVDIHIKLNRIPKATEANPPPKEY